MIGYFGLARSKRARWEGQSVRIASANPSFSSVSGGLSLASAVHSAFPVAPLTATPTTLAGIPVIAIAGSPAPSQHAPKGSRVTLYVSKRSSPLPLQASLAAPRGVTATVKFSRWGEHLDLTPPAHAIPWSTLI
jgi:hypothetical protein